MTINPLKGEHTRLEGASYRISDKLWAALQTLLPEPQNTHRYGGGRTRVPDRVCANGIFYVLRNGLPWKALDQTDICSGSTAHARFQEWVQHDVFQKLWQARLEYFDTATEVDYNWLTCFLIIKRGQSAKHFKNSIMSTKLPRVLAGGG